MYNRTQDENGNYSTRCLDCFLTIASAIQSEEELAAIEARHICPEKALSWLIAQERSSPALREYADDRGSAPTAAAVSSPHGG
jgi:hypothetical protein